MKIEVVIGANYGDEGKGLFTEYLCKTRPSPVVVMSNGGCQRGHTVNNVEKGIRHVFHHFGSGTLIGTPTLLSKNFLLNPIVFVKEFKELCHLGMRPEIVRVPQNMLQFPSDMFINQQLEKHRTASNMAHGSCGFGIWETMVRNKDYKPILFNDFLGMDEAGKKKCLDEVLEWQIENRLKCEDGLQIDNDTLNVIRSENFVKHFINDFITMDTYCPCLEILAGMNVIEIIEAAGYDTAIVENAQGLLLDKTYAPADENGRTDVHSTPSKTGLSGALESLDCDVSFCDVIPNYISRTYMTRHGAGPFPENTPGLMYEDITNEPNEYQGTMQFGKISNDIANLLLQRISIDAHSCNCSPRLVLTHMNEARCMMLEENANYFSYEDDSSKIKERKISK